MLLFIVKDPGLGFVQGDRKICDLGSRKSVVVAGSVRLIIGLGWRRKNRVPTCGFELRPFLDFYGHITNNNNKSVKIKKNKD